MFSKFPPSYFFPMLYAASTSFSFFPFTESMLITVPWQLFNLWYLAQSLDLIAIKLSDCINLFQGIRK